MEDQNRMNILGRFLSFQKIMLPYIKAKSSAQILRFLVQFN